MKLKELLALAWLTGGIWTMTPLFAQQSPERLPFMPTPPPQRSYSLNDLIQLSLSQNPGLGQAQFEIEAAAGKADQAGRYPNPTVSVGGEEIGRRGGIYTWPLVSQEIVTANKLGLSRAVANSETDQAALGLQSKRLTLFTAVRQGYFEVLSLKRRKEFLEQVQSDWEKRYKKFEDEKVKKALGQVGFLPFRIELNRLKIDAESTSQEYRTGIAKLAATVGAPRLEITTADEFTVDQLPGYPVDKAVLEAWRALVAERHPEVVKAQVGVRRAELTVRREQAQKIPNVTVGGGYQRNYNDREHQAIFQVGVPLPLYNRNQGGIRAAQAELARLVLEINRVQYELLGSLAGSYGQYAQSRQRAEQLKKYAADTEALAKATFADWQAPGSQLTALNVAQAQRVAIDARLDFLRAWGDSWRAASEIAGLLDDNLSTALTPKK